MATDQPEQQGRPDGGRRDADLAIAAAAGDREALGEIYDRYAPRVHSLAVRLLRDRDAAADVTQETFLAAAQRLDGLREPERLRAWLFAVARHEVVNHVRRASRAVPTDAVEDLETAQQADEGFDRVHGQELRTLMADTRAGLDDRDRLVLELAYGEQLSGAGIAAALGVREDNAHQLLSRARHRLRASLGALLVARRGRDGCAGLDQVLAAWDGEFSTVWRKRVVRHVEGCDSCGDLQRRVLSPTALSTAFPLVALPVGLRERVLAHVDLVASGGSGGEPWGDDGFPPSGGQDLAVLGASRPDGAEPDGADPDGADPDGADPDGADPDGADPDGADPDGADPGGPGRGVAAVLTSTTALLVATALGVGAAVVVGTSFVLGAGSTGGPDASQVRAPALTAPVGDGGEAPRGGTSAPAGAAAASVGPVTSAPATSAVAPPPPPATTAASAPDPPTALQLLVRPGGGTSAVTLSSASDSSVTLTVAHTADGPVDVSLAASAALVVTPGSLVVPAGDSVPVEVRWRTRPAAGEVTVQADGARAVTVRVEPAGRRPTTAAATVAPVARVTPLTPVASAAPAAPGSPTGRVPSPGRGAGPSGAVSPSG